MELVVKDISFGYNKNVNVLDKVSFSVRSGEVLGILGPNGTGKTTLLKCINNIIKYRSGDIYFNGQSLSGLNQIEMAKIIAYVPQYINNMFPASVIDTVSMGRLPYSRYGYSEEDRKIAFDTIRIMNLEKFAFRNIMEMSGGERQRVLIARAMVQQPKIITLDEPTSSLDLHNQLFILKLVSEIAKTNNISIIMTIHDLNLASMFCDNLLMLKDSHVFAYGKSQEVINEKNISEMYNVNTKVSFVDGFKHVRLLKE